MENCEERENCELGSRGMKGMTVPNFASVIAYAGSAGLGEKALGVSRFGLAVRRYAGKQGDLDSNPPRLSFLFKSGYCLVTFSLAINETLKCLSSLPILMQESF